MSETRESLTPEGALIEFITTFEASLDPRLWVKLVEEELKELLDADRNGEGRAAVLKELIDLAYVSVGLSLVIPNVELVVPAKEADEWNCLYDETAETAGVVIDKYDFKPDVLQEAFLRVHASNMSKLGDDGKPIRRDDGKVLKGPNYLPPDLSDL